MTKINYLLATFMICFFSHSTVVLARDNAVEVDILTQTNQPLQQFTIPEHLYMQGETKEFNQIAILDKFGTALPFEVSIYKRIIKQEKRAIKIYALKEMQYLQTHTKNIILKYDSKNRLTEVQKNNGENIDVEVVKGYLLDLGERFPREDSRLTFELSQVADTSFLKFDIDISSDLKNWRKVTKGEVIAQLVNQNIVTQHNSISLLNVRSRYVRLTILGNNPKFKIYSVQQDFDRLTSKPLSWTNLKEMHFNEKEQGYLLNISPDLNYRRFQVQMTTAPSIITGSLTHRANTKSRWSSSEPVNLINIENENTRILENEFPIWSGYRTQLKLSANYSLPLLNKQPLWVKLAYEPQKVTFFANGNSPYKIKIGGVAGKQNNKESSQLLATIKKQSGNAIGLATLGNSRVVNVDMDKSETNWSKILLWFVLLSGVALMAWMAKGLMKQMD